MNDDCSAADMEAEEVVQALLSEVIAARGCTIEEAFRFLRHEITLEFERRVRERRAVLRVISQ